MDRDEFEVYLDEFKTHLAETERIILEWILRCNTEAELRECKTAARKMFREIDQTIWKPRD
jgi:hypothetical protein